MISVIIPVYNAEEYIARCLDSIIAQSYHELDIICIDDGSTDNSAQICKEYADKDDRIRYYYIDNGGVSNARNYALELVKGEWFAFVDSDDWLEPEFYKVLISNALKNNCDISACQFQKNDRYKTGYDGSIEDIHVFCGYNECVHSYICCDNSLEGQVWNKIYKTDKYAGIRFSSKLKVNEDCMYTYDIVKRCQRACVCNAQLYHWYMRENSACHNRNKTVNLAAANVFLELYRFTKDLNDTEVSEELMKNYMCTATKILLDAKKTRNDNDIKQAIANMKKFKKRIWNIIPVKEKIKYYYVIIKYSV